MRNPISWEAITAWCMVLAVIMLVSMGVHGMHKGEEALMSKIKQCFEQEKAHCSDKICEMSTDYPYEILEQVESNIMECVGK